MNSVAPCAPAERVAAPSAGSAGSGADGQAAPPVALHRRPRPVGGQLERRELRQLLPPVGELGRQDLAGEPARAASGRSPRTGRQLAAGATAGRRWTAP